MTYGLRPLQILLVTISSSFVYGLFYASLAAFPILFEDTRLWNALPFLGIMLDKISGAAQCVKSEIQHLCLRVEWPQRPA